MIGDHELELVNSDIYFIIGLSRTGEPANLHGARAIGASVNMLLVEHSPKALKSKSGKVYIMSVNDLVLKTLPLTINKLARAQEFHESNKSKFHYVIDCTTLNIFN